MTIDDILNDMADKLNLEIVDRDAKTPWEQLGITTTRWNTISHATVKNIQAAQKIANNEFNRKLTLAEKLVEISKVNPTANELALLSAAIMLK